MGTKFYCQHEGYAIGVSLIPIQPRPKPGIPTKVNIANESLINHVKEEECHFINEKKNKLTQPHS